MNRFQLNIWAVFCAMILFAAAAFFIAEFVVPPG